MDFFVDFVLCPSHYILDINEKILMLLVGAPSRDRESLGTKQTEGKSNAEVAP